MPWPRRWRTSARLLRQHRGQAFARQRRVLIDEVWGLVGEQDARYACVAELLQQGQERAAHVVAPLAGRQQAGPAVEDLHGIRAGAVLFDEITGDQFRQAFEQGAEGDRMLVKERAGAEEAAGAATLDDVGGQRPRGAAEAEQGGRVVESLAHESQRRRHRSAGLGRYPPAGNARLPGCRCGGRAPGRE